MTRCDSSAAESVRSQAKTFSSDLEDHARECRPGAVQHEIDKFVDFFQLLLATFARSKLTKASWT